MLVLIVNRNRLHLLLISILALSILFSGSLIVAKKYSDAKNAATDQEKYLILIEIDEKLLYLFKEGECIKKYPIASGKKGWPSPIGDWTIINKGDWGEGFGGRWLGLDVRWGKYGIHGCIRMYNRHIKELYDIVQVGTPVIIRNGIFGPFGTGFRDLVPGDRGADVLAVQERLKDLGYFKGYESGIYEDNLKKAISRFQKDQNLRVKHTITREDYNAMGFFEFE